MQYKPFLDRAVPLVPSELSLDASDLASTDREPKLGIGEHNDNGIRRLNSNLDAEDTVVGGVACETLRANRGLVCVGHVVNNCMTI